MISSPTTWPLQGWEKLNHGMKGIVQMFVQHWQAWGIDHLSSLFQDLTICVVSKYFLMLSVPLCWCSFEPLINYLYCESLYICPFI